MATYVSPLDLLLDAENPRFVILSSRTQANIRKYLVTYEDVSNLAKDINNYGGLFPGERIVVLKKGDKYVVVEGNRRTCSLQLLLSPELVPDGFKHRIPMATEKLKENCFNIEVDIVSDRNAALELMTKRHIEGVKQWKPLAKKQFFASNYKLGQSISNLSTITGINQSNIKKDIRDYKFFFAAYTKYRNEHPDFKTEIVNLKIDPFLRIFNVKFTYNGCIVKPLDILKIFYDENHNTVSKLPHNIFTVIVQIVFEKTIINEEINTRNTLKDIPEIIQILNNMESDDHNAQTDTSDINGSDNSTSNNKSKKSSATDNTTSGKSTNENDGPKPDGPKPDGPKPGGPKPGGPAPRVFFETISWQGKLSPENDNHAGLLTAINELYQLSKQAFNKKKAYEMFPVATGMILRTAYEQILRLRLQQTNLWGTYMQLNPKKFPTLKGMEKFIINPTNKAIVLPTDTLNSAIDKIISYTHRDFLNANVHEPGAIRVSPDALEGIAQGGMFTLIQELINLL